MNRNTNTDAAVSPVVGVMLMLVVTIIIAAVAAAFAGGLSETASVAPNTALDLKIRAAPSTSMILVDEPAAVLLQITSGDPLPSKDIQIITTYTVPDTFNGNPTTFAGKVIKHTLDGALARTNQWTNPANPADVFTPQVNGYNTVMALGNGMVGSGAPYFGTAIFEPGYKYYLINRNAVLGFDISDYTSYGFQEGSIVHVTVIHKPSGQTIMDKDVVVTW